MWWFGKMSDFCLSVHLSARLSPNIHVLDFFDFLPEARNIQKSRPTSVEKGIKNELSGFLKSFII